jgi:hypothetical protein
MKFSAPLQNLIEALRNELQQYGEMLALLDHQKDMIQQRGSDDILHSISAINTQSAMIQVARETRMFNQRQLALSLKGPMDATFAQLIPQLPEGCQPLITALVHENNELLLRVQQRAQENQTLLRRSVDLMQQFITSLAPAPKNSPRSGKAGSVTEVERAGALFETIL